MQLGTLLDQLTDETSAAEIVLQIGDLALLASLRTQATAHGLDLATYITSVVARYVSAAPGEEWAHLIGLLNRADDPASALLGRVLARGAEF